MDNKDKVNQWIKNLLLPPVSYNPTEIKKVCDDIDSLYKPSKVKLPKAAYEWMEKNKNDYACRQ